MELTVLIRSLKTKCFVLITYQTYLPQIINTDILKLMNGSRKTVKKYLINQKPITTRH